MKRYEKLLLVIITVLFCNKSFAESSKSMTRFEALSGKNSSGSKSEWDQNSTKVYLENPAKFQKIIYI